MATPANVYAFYARSRWGNLWHIKGPLYGPDGHRGHDIKTGAREAVPALRSGVVEYVGESTILGPVVVIKVNATTYDGYAHLYGVTVEQGDIVSAGDYFARTAGYGDFHGSAWLGPHLHITDGAYAGSVYSGATRNPAIVINAILTSAVVTPAAAPKPAVAVAKANATTNTTPLEEEEMPYELYRTVGPGAKGRIGVAGGKSGFVWLGDPLEVEALIVGKGGDPKTFKFREVNEAQFERMLTALTR